MKARPLFFACAFAAMLLAAPGRVLAGNFSKSVTADETASAGLAQLSSDQLSALDALVRRDLALAANTPPAAARPARFSARLSESERRSAGLTLLTAAKLEQLDTLVKRFASAPPPPLTSPSATVGDKTEANGPQTVSWRRKPEIHGMMALMYGVGSHGYSERGGATGFGSVPVDDLHLEPTDVDISTGHGAHVVRGPALSIIAALLRRTTFDDDLSANAIEQYVSRLRKRLAPHGLTVRTARGIGYYLEKVSP